LRTLLGDTCGEALERRRFRGKPGECVSFDRPGAMPSNLTLVGLGEPARFDLAALRAATAAGVRAAARLGVKQLGVLLPVEGLEPKAAASHLGLVSCS
jgi:leucyl aminopeptidase